MPRQDTSEAPSNTPKKGIAEALQANEKIHESRQLSWIAN